MQMLSMRLRTLAISEDLATCPLKTMVDFNLRLCKIQSHAMDLPEGVLAYYLLNCANLSDEQTALCRATCVNPTYDDMKKRSEHPPVMNHQPAPTLATSKFKLKHKT